MRVEPYTVLRGPLVARAGTRLLGGEIGSGSTLGPGCKVRGEVQNAIFVGNSNKAHEGYVGDSYIGEWVNLGAGTTTSNLKNNYGYVRLPGFNEKATDALTSSIADLKAKNPKMKGLILDLRNNPGGLLDQAVGVADVFLDGGEVVSQRGRDPRNIQRYNAKPGDLLNGMKMVVLINQGSASARTVRWSATTIRTFMRGTRRPPSARCSRCTAAPVSRP